MLAALLRHTGLRYLGVSVVALGADTGLFLALIGAGISPALASALGYTLGIGVHWLLSSRLVYAHALANGALRRRQQGMFVASALVGLGVTTGVVGGLTHAGLDPRGAKLVAVGAGFLVTWALRQMVVFAPRPAT